MSRQTWHCAPRRIPVSKRAEHMVEIQAFRDNQSRHHDLTDDFGELAVVDEGDDQRALDQLANGFTGLVVTDDAPDL